MSTLRERGIGAVSPKYLFTATKDIKFDYYSKHQIDKGSECIGYIEINGGCYVLTIVTFMYLSEKYPQFPQSLTTYGSIETIEETIKTFGIITEVVDTK